ncbi:tRNA pseudouridine(38-40) synthase TruA [Spirochaeta africana]|uniref:tRNA pseudouridine synthase A n=1 Tax=Spirochaeta africana (strain ATCC 700263 / DSM 8902 / Z-7692) TaxID=889378 RepID=H9UI21_SPIAZ|nr:tRNA pseudouridine(38-40) synthase TruA [Spirochaeta africana]AFG37164.1 pseudouridylate synthase I [Spirochaeta africana DSM 8902]
MRNILLDIQYDGTDFCGWQIQVGQRTVQGELEKALERLHRHPVSLLTAGRTDSGVHAAGQAGNFRSDMDSIPPQKFASALNSMLPRDVRIRGSREVHADFHATHSALERRYRYAMYCARFADPLLDRYRLRLPGMPSLSRLNQMASLLVGTHDFASVASPKEDQTTVRTITSAAFYPDQSGLLFEIAGNGFLWKMVRTIVGTVLLLAEQPDAAVMFQRILAARDRGAAGKTAAPHGLSLYQVRYPAELLVPAGTRTLEGTP